MQGSCASSDSRSTVYIPGVSPSPTSATATADNAGLDQADHISPQLAALAAETAEKLAAQKSLCGRWLQMNLSQLRMGFDNSKRVVLVMLLPTWHCNSHRDKSAEASTQCAKSACPCSSDRSTCENVGRLQIMIPAAGPLEQAGESAAGVLPAHKRLGARGRKQMCHENTCDCAF